MPLLKRVGNALLYLGLGAERADYPRDEDGFEPLEYYFPKRKEQDSDSESDWEERIEEERRRRKNLIAEVAEKRRLAREAAEKRLAANKAIPTPPKDNQGGGESASRGVAKGVEPLNIPILSNAGASDPIVLDEEEDGEKEGVPPVAPPTPPPKDVPVVTHGGRESTVSAVSAVSLYSAENSVFEASSQPSSSPPKTSRLLPSRLDFDNDEENVDSSAVDTGEAPLPPTEPQKRRGRPPKSHRSTVVASDSSGGGGEPAATQPLKRGRGRPPKKKPATLAASGGESDYSDILSPPRTSSEDPPPAKRGRGAAAKKAATASGGDSDHGEPSAPAQSSNSREEVQPRRENPMKRVPAASGDNSDHGEPSIQAHSSKKDLQPAKQRRGQPPKRISSSVGGESDQGGPSPPLGSSKESAKPARRGRGRPPKRATTTSVVGIDGELSSKEEPRPVNQEEEGMANSTSVLSNYKQTEPSIETTQTVKRGRGRPPKEHVSSDPPPQQAAKKQGNEIPPQTTSAASNSDHGETSSVPVKRGRGRPPKVMASISSDSDHGETSSVPVKRGRGRPPKVMTSISSDSDHGDSETSSMPVKRGRGRPPKATTSVSSDSERDEISSAEPQAVVKRGPPKKSQTALTATSAGSELSDHGEPFSPEDEHQQAASLSPTLPLPPPKRPRGRPRKDETMKTTMPISKAQRINFDFSSDTGEEEEIQVDKVLEKLLNESRGEKLSEPQPQQPPPTSRFQSLQHIAVLRMQSQAQAGGKVTNKSSAAVAGPSATEEAEKSGRGDSEAATKAADEAERVAGGKSSQGSSEGAEKAADKLEKVPKKSSLDISKTSTAQATLLSATVRVSKAGGRKAERSKSSGSSSKKTPKVTVAPKQPKLAKEKESSVVSISKGASQRRSKRPVRSGNSSSQWFVPEDITPSSVRRAAAKAASKGGFSPRRLRSALLSSGEEEEEEEEEKEVVVESSEGEMSGSDGRGNSRAGHSRIGAGSRRKILLDSSSEKLWRQSGASSESELGEGREKKGDLGKGRKKKGDLEEGRKKKKRAVLDSDSETGKKGGVSEGDNDTLNKTAGKNGGMAQQEDGSGEGVASGGDDWGMDVDMDFSLSEGEGGVEKDDPPPAATRRKGESSQDEPLTSEAADSELGDSDAGRKGKGRVGRKRKLDKSSQRAIDSIYSFREDSDTDIDLVVKTPGGKKYRRMEPIRPVNPTPGKRRSKRARIPPVKPWENQKADYDTKRHSGYALTGLLVPYQQNKGQKGRKKQLKDELDDSHYLPLHYVDNVTDVTRTEQIVYTRKSAHNVNGAGDMADDEDYPEVVVQKIPKNTGVIVFAPLAQKPDCAVGNCEMIFFVLKGRMLFTINGQEYEVAASQCHVIVPSGTCYSIKNLGKGTAEVLYFVSTTPISP